MQLKSHIVFGAIKRGPVPANSAIGSPYGAIGFPYGPSVPLTRRLLSLYRSGPDLTQTDVIVRFWYWIWIAVKWVNLISARNQKAADVWKKDVWDFQAFSRTFLELRFSLGDEGKDGKNLNSQTWPGTPRPPSSRHPRPLEERWRITCRTRFFSHLEYNDWSQADTGLSPRN